MYFGTTSVSTLPQPTIYYSLCLHLSQYLQNEHGEQAEPKLNDERYSYSQELVILRLHIVWSLLCLIKQGNVHFRNFPIKNELQNFKGLKIAE